MENKGFIMVGVYADYEKRNHKICVHPSYLLEDDENYYIIHLTSNKSGAIDVLDDEIVLLNTISKEYQKSSICRKIAVISKVNQERARIERPGKLLLMKNSNAMKETEELRQIIKRHLRDGAFEMYDADFKCFKEIPKKFNNQTNLMEEMLKVF